jgi:hypothetical protein
LVFIAVSPSIIISEAVIIADEYYDDLLAIEEKIGKNMLLMLPRIGLMTIISLYEVWLYVGLVMEYQF